MLRINDEAPNFMADTSKGKIDFHQWIGDGWAILFSHPKDFTPVCTTELGYMAGLEPEFAKRNCKISQLISDMFYNFGWAGVQRRIVGTQSKAKQLQRNREDRNGDASSFLGKSE